MEEVKTLKKWIIVFSVIAAIIMIGSPFLIYFGVNNNIQWVGFFASYLGGIFGGIVSGGLTFGGVYLTIQHQNKLLNQEKVERFSYVYGKFLPRFWSLQEAVENDRQLSLSEQVENIRNSASEFQKIIEENMEIMKNDYKLLKHAESIDKWLAEMITLSKSGEPNPRMMEGFEHINRFIQQQYEWLNKYDENLH